MTTKLYRITDIDLPGFDVLAEDNDHAAQIFISALMTGLKNQPFCDFDVLEFTDRRLKRHDVLRRWAEEGRTGIPWWIADERQWELVPYDLQRS